ncbi:MAG: hypothetical protein B0D91_12720 [Oceanospirillales bacterium LUC14_002_19_P2]|nr:MAG: hypothetical protein B0D91_12720 [Oceanospirillales bacterium LUC14_002_19_P2]
MSQEKYLLAIDNGTQSVRGLLFDLQGELVGKSRVELNPYFSPNPGWAEQDPDYYWQAVGRACRELWRETEISASAVSGVSVTTQRGTVVCVDKQGKALRPAILWLDQRRADTKEAIGGGWDLIAAVTGLRETLDYFRSKCQARWLAQNQPDLWKSTHKFLLLSGWHTWKLTGEFKDSTGCQVGYIPFDYKRQQWAKSFDWKWRCTGIRRAQLPELVKPGELLGHVTKAASEFTGIPEGLPVIAAAADKACEVIGSGCADAGTGCLSYGTTATINTVNYKYVVLLQVGG